MKTITAFSLPELAVDRFRDIVGTEGVLLTDEERNSYRDPYWFQEDRTYDSSAVLFPTSTEQVQAIVAVANDFEIPLWTSSQGRNNGYGGPSGRVKGSVLISFRRMNKVLEINAELAYAVVEPGVRWIDLQEALKESGNDNLMISVPDIGWGSVVGNSLDNGLTYLPYGSDFMAPTGMEVVLANGELLRTGMGAIPGNKSWHLYKRGLGPTLDPLFMQSNYGIVTQMGYWLMRRPRAYAPMFLTIPQDSQLERAIDIVRELRLDGVIRGMPTIQNTLTLSGHFPDLLGQFAGADGVFSEDALQSLADASGVGRWGMRLALYGDETVVEHHVKRVTEAWKEIDGGRVDHHRTFLRHEWNEIVEFGDKVQAGIPNLDMLKTIPEHIGHIGFSPVVPMVGSEVRDVVELIKNLVVERVGTNFVCAIYPFNERSCIVVSSLSFDTTDQEQTEASVAAAKMLVEEAGKLGYGEYRAHIDFMDIAAEQYSFNDHAYRKFCETIKDAVDPKGILSPGRHGIWPARMRQERQS